MKMLRKFWFVLMLVMALALLLVPTVYAQGTTPPVETVPSTIDASLIAYVLLITGFFKQQFNLNGKMVLLVGFILTVVFGFLPDIEALLPAAAIYIDKFFLIVKVFLSSAGLFDTLVNVGAKIATATLNKAGALSTDGSALVK